MSDSSLSHHRFADCLWVRCTSRGSFVNSPALKSVCEAYLTDGGTDIVVDLELCPGVDSTFMGTLAGLARKCMAKGGGIQIAEPSERTQEAMESLGLDMLVDINPSQAAWLADLSERRAVLAADTHATEGTDLGMMSERAHTEHVLEAHNTLRSMNSKNADTFGYVCETLEEDLLRHSAEDDEL